MQRSRRGQRGVPWGPNSMELGLKGQRWSPQECPQGRAGATDRSQSPPTSDVVTGAGGDSPEGEWREVKSAASHRVMPSVRPGHQINVSSEHGETAAGLSTGRGTGDLETQFRWSDGPGFKGGSGLREGRAGNSFGGGDREGEPGNEARVVG